MKFLKRFEDKINRQREVDVNNLHTSLFIGFAQILEDGKSKEVPLSIHPGVGTMRELGNTLVVGPPGSGKTSLIRNNLMNWGHSAIVIDLKGQLYQETAQRRRDLGQKVYMLDVRRGTGHRYNPLAHVNKSQWRELAHTFVSMQTSEPFWINCCLDMWLALWHAAEEAKKPHIPYAVQILSLGFGEAMQYVVKHHSDNDDAMKYLSSFAGRLPTMEWASNLNDKSTRLLESKWSSVTATVALLDDPHLMNIFSGDDIPVEDLFYDEGLSTIYIQADETKPVLFTVFSRLVTKTLGDALISEGDKNNKRRPILFFFDEFGVIRLNNIRQWLDTMRSRDIVLMLFVQEFDHLAPAVGEKFDENSINSIHHLILFKPVDPSGRIANKIFELSGRQSIELENRGFSFGKGGRTNNVSYSQHERRIIEQEDLELWPMNAAYTVLTAQTTVKAIVRIPRMNSESDAWTCRQSEPLQPLLPFPPLLETENLEFLPKEKQAGAAEEALSLVVAEKPEDKLKLLKRLRMAD